MQTSSRSRNHESNPIVTNNSNVSFHTIRYTPAIRSSPLVRPKVSPNSPDSSSQPARPFLPETSLSNRAQLHITRPHPPIIHATIVISPPFAHMKLPTFRRPRRSTRPKRAPVLTTSAASTKYRDGISTFQLPHIFVDNDPSALDNDVASQQPALSALRRRDSPFPRGASPRAVSTDTLVECELVEHSLQNDTSVLSLADCLEQTLLIKTGSDVATRRSLELKRFPNRPSQQSVASVRYPSVRLSIESLFSDMTSTESLRSPAVPGVVRA